MNKMNTSSIFQEINQILFQLINQLFQEINQQFFKK